MLGCEAPAPLLGQVGAGGSGLLRLRHRRGLGPAGSVLYCAQTAQRIALDPLLALGVLPLLLTLANLLELRLPTVGSRQPQPPRFTDLRLTELRRDARAEVRV